MDKLTQFMCESWSLFAAAVLFTLVRLLARVRLLGFKGLQGDDYLALIALLSFSGELGIAHIGGSMFYKAKAAGQLLAQTGTALPNPAGSKTRELALKLHFALSFLYTTTLWLLKASLLTLYLRLTREFSGRYRSRVFAGFGFLAVSWVAIILTIFLGCRPFHQYFDPDPNKSTFCQPGESPAILYTCYALNVLTDVWLISIPLPMVSKLVTQPWKRMGLALLFSLGAVVVVFATTRCVLIATVPKEGGAVGSKWAIRETFVAIITANFPMAFSLIKEGLGLAFKSIRSLGSHKVDGQRRHHRKRSGEVETIGGTGRSRRFRRAGDPTKRYAFFELESEVEAVNGMSASAGMDAAPGWSGMASQRNPDCPESDAEVRSRGG
ncbi:hypothetical protein ACRE_033150 [Hapsidospora chrysogenum ATCC 11550]|uniref:Rhodopsin domain-containing protein n=1 Tax=Hapsidospora chrysogenum (strain ATCC 11550 / CBS 779.69 / DSM 880 / IAM 14645 / JCM 23072 / IMI 49137) TaxID=857340 RepID=A0A086T937_HAPC1|nr:hypothetical protein ACRE_033150 [Hapsidospora chrysogenum ATCC 11550]